MKNRTKIFLPNLLLRKFLYSVSDFISPVHCLVCTEYFNNQIGRNKFICNKCYDNMPFANDKEMILNRMFKNFPENKCYIDEATSLFNIESQQNYDQIIYALKYDKFQNIGYEFGKLLAERLNYDNMIHYDLIIPIPIHIAKKRERGFNQSDIIASTISKALNISFSDEILIRHKYTVTQTLLNKNQRLNNMINVFSVNSKIDIKNKSILLVDDVLTTGSTLNSAAELLKQSGCWRVGVATIALANKSGS